MSAGDWTRPARFARLELEAALASMHAVAAEIEAVPDDKLDDKLDQLERRWYAVEDRVEAAEKALERNWERWSIDMTDEPFEEARDDD